MRNLPAILMGLALGGAIALIAQSWGQGGPTTTPFTMGVAVSACGTTPYTYVAGKEVPITIAASTGALCVNQ